MSTRARRSGELLLDLFRLLRGAVDLDLARPHGFWIVLTLTYTIALGDFTHVVAGAAEAFLLVFGGQIGMGRRWTRSSFRR